MRRSKIGDVPKPVPIGGYCAPWDAPYPLEAARRESHVGPVTDYTRAGNSTGWDNCFVTLCEAKHPCEQLSFEP